MKLIDLTNLDEAVDLLTDVLGDDIVDWRYIEGLKLGTILLSDSGDSIVVFYKMFEGKYHMHQASRVGGKDMTDLLREAIQYPFESLGASLVIGFVPERRIRLLIGMNSNIKPLRKVEGEYLYLITKENLKDIWRK